jgi:transposase
MDKPAKTVRKRPRRTFTPEFKAEAVRLCRVGDRSIAQVAKDLDLTETALREWVQRAGIDAGNGPAGALTSDERAELARLRREVKQRQMEREILALQEIVWAETGLEYRSRPPRWKRIALRKRSRLRYPHDIALIRWIR